MSENESKCLELLFTYSFFPKYFEIFNCFLNYLKRSNTKLEIVLNKQENYLKTEEAKSWINSYDKMFYPLLYFVSTITEPFLSIMAMLINIPYTIFINLAPEMFRILSNIIEMYFPELMLDKAECYLDYKVDYSKSENKSHRIFKIFDVAFQRSLHYVIEYLETHQYLVINSSEESQKNAKTIEENEESINLRLGQENDYNKRDEAIADSNQNNMTKDENKNETVVNNNEDSQTNSKVVHKSKNKTSSKLQRRHSRHSESNGGCWEKSNAL